MTVVFENDLATVYLADCREVDLPRHSVDLVIVDPPYGVNHQSRGTHAPIMGDEDNAWVRDALAHSFRSLKMNRHFYAFGPDVVSDLTVCPTIELVWDKGRMAAGGDAETVWSPGHERITFGMFSTYESHRSRGAGLARLRRSTVLRVPKVNNGRGSYVHPNQKPVELLRVMIEASSQFGEVVLDPMMGSGSTLVAAILEGRRAIGIENDPRWIETAVARVKEATARVRF